MFTTPCFIRKNTPELRKKLRELGYHPHPSEKKLYEQYSNYVGPSLHTGRGFYAIMPIGYDEELRFEIHCKDNEDLFIAIAALRDDSDINQWFVMDVEIYMNLPEGTWFKATDMNGEKHVGTQIDPFYCHKATVEELIEHFKD